MEIKVVRSVLRANEGVAERNRLLFDELGILSVNLMSAPGSGKTSLLQATLKACGLLP